jgi:hypothetical protein
MANEPKKPAPKQPMSPQQPTKKPPTQGPGGMPGANPGGPKKS